MPLSIRTKFSELPFSPETVSSYHALKGKLDGTWNILPILKIRVWPPHPLTVITSRPYISYKRYVGIPTVSQPTRPNQPNQTRSWNLLTGFVQKLQAFADDQSFPPKQPQCWEKTSPWNPVSVIKSNWLFLCVSTFKVFTNKPQFWSCCAFWVLFICVPNFGLQGWGESWWIIRLQRWLRFKPKVYSSLAIQHTKNVSSCPIWLESQVSYWLLPRAFHNQLYYNLYPIKFGWQKPRKTTDQLDLTATHMIFLLQIPSTSAFPRHFWHLPGSFFSGSWHGCRVYLRGLRCRNHWFGLTGCLMCWIGGTKLLRSDHLDSYHIHVTCHKQYPNSKCAILFPSVCSVISP